MPLRYDNDTSDQEREAYLVASPNAFDLQGIGDSQVALIRRIDRAKRDIHVEVMEYSPSRFGVGAYPVIDDALRRAAARGVHIRLLIADWSLTAKRIPALQSMDAMPYIEIRVATIAPASSGPIPFARVVHTKDMTVHRVTAWVGTSNWEGGYLDKSRNLELVFQNRGMAGRVDALEDALWTSTYAAPLTQAIADKARKAHPRP